MIVFPKNVHHMFPSKEKLPPARQTAIKSYCMEKKAQKGNTNDILPARFEF